MYTTIIDQALVPVYQMILSMNSRKMQPGYKEGLWQWQE